MNDQRDEAEERHDLQIALGPVQVEHAPQGKQRGRQGGAPHKGHRFDEYTRQMQAGQVHDKTSSDGQDQDVARHRPANLAQSLKRAVTLRACDLHCGDANRIAKRRMQRDDRIVSSQSIRAEGAFGDGQAQQKRVREERDEPKRHRVGPRATKQIPSTKKTREEPRQSTRVEAEQQGRVEFGFQVQPGDGQKQKAGDRDALGEFHQPIYRAIRQHIAPPHDIAETDHQKDRQDDVDQSVHEC